MYCRRKNPLLVVAMVLLIPASQVAGQQPDSDSNVVLVAPAPVVTPGPAQLLPDKLAGAAASNERRELGRDQLALLVQDKAGVYQEYQVTLVHTREYGASRVDVFETTGEYSSFGLFNYESNVVPARPVPLENATACAKTPGVLFFHKGIYFVRVVDTRQPKSDPASKLNLRIAGVIAAAIPEPNPETVRPALLNSLPKDNVVAGTERYAIGAEALSRWVQRARETFLFQGEAEAVVAEYQLAPDASAAVPASESVAARARATAAPAPRLQLIIVEFHTPSFASDGMDRAREALEALPEAERQRIILKREGNFLIQAMNVDDRSAAQQLVDSVTYPYSVKWLRNPLWATTDPFRAQKAAAMLVSTFGILGLILLTVFVVGSGFGTLIFLHRRKQQREVFSDAGGMMGLHLDPVEASLLGLPPHSGTSD